MSLEVLLRSLGSYWGLLRCSLAATFVLHDDVINSYPYNMSQVIGCNRYSTVGVEMTSIRWFLRYAHCDCFLAAILELHYDVIHSYTCNVIQVIGCNRYGTGRRWNEVDRTAGFWAIDIKNELLAAILVNGVLVANMSQCSGSLEEIEY